eukprot:6686423-Pyramimonas_sp.AAC.1
MSIRRGVWCHHDKPPQALDKSSPLAVPSAHYASLNSVSSRRPDDAPLALNTFIDDLFAFIITMPTMHRLSTFRDDIIFFIFLYQKWIYPIDHTRSTDAEGSPLDPRTTRPETPKNTATTKEKPTTPSTPTIDKTMKTTTEPSSVLRRSTRKRTEKSF